MATYMKKTAFQRTLTNAPVRPPRIRAAAAPDTKPSCCHPSKRVRKKKQEKVTVAPEATPGMEEMGPEKQGPTALAPPTSHHGPTETSARRLRPGARSPLAPAPWTLTLSTHIFLSPAAADRSTGRRFLAESPSWGSPSDLISGGVGGAACARQPAQVQRFRPSAQPTSAPKRAGPWGRLKTTQWARVGGYGPGEVEQGCPSGEPRLPCQGFGRRKRPHPCLLTFYKLRVWLRGNGCSF